MSKLAKRLGSAVPRHLLPSTQATKRVVNNFAEEYGLVYFGYVSQRSDDHHIVRGLTVSNQHIDDHYCIGTYEGYDVVFVERRDHIHGRDHVWHIMEFDLTSGSDIPHSFIGSGTHGKGFHELLSAKYPALLPHNFGLTGQYPANFTGSFVAYSSPAHALDLELLITPTEAAVIGSHFKGLVIELTEQALYIYSEKSHVNPDLLVAMIKNGVWLAQSIDKNSQS